MTTSHDLERSLGAWMQSAADEGLPDYLDEIVHRVALERQRAWWSSPERWLPVDTTLRLSPVPRAAWLLVILALVFALGAAIAIVGSLPRHADPFGPARNGSLVYSGANGDLYVFDPATDRSKSLVMGPEVDLSPNFSPDGSRIVFGRETGLAGQYLLMIANADGRNVRALSPPLVGLEWAMWSPDSSRLAVVAGPEGAKSLSILGLDGTALPILERDLEPEQVQWRPDGRELVFRGYDPDLVSFGLYVVRADGTGLRAILPPTFSEEHWQEPALSPDGTRIMYTQWWGDAYPGGHLYVVDVDSGDAQVLEFDGDFESDYIAEWSPDGSQIVFNQGTAQERYSVAVGPAGGGHAVRLGPEQSWDSAASTAFSPDGSKVIALYGNGSGWILPVSGAPGQRLPATDFLGTWQRLPR